jgi:hypothetical protein
MEYVIPKLGSQGSLAAFEMDLLVLIVQLVVLYKHIRSWAASAGTDHPNKFVDLHDGIQRQLV